MCNDARFGKYGSKKGEALWLLCPPPPHLAIIINGKNNFFFDLMNLTRYIYLLDILEAIHFCQNLSKILCYVSVKMHTIIAKKQI